MSLPVAGFSIKINAQSSLNDSLYKSSVSNQSNSFTSNVEAPAFDKKGIVYAVKFEKEGTIGQLTPEGASALFII